MLPPEASLAAPNKVTPQANGSDLIVSAKTSRRETAASVFEGSSEGFTTLAIPATILTASPKRGCIFGIAILVLAIGIA
jgi:hypothetical protein